MSNKYTNPDDLTDQQQPMERNPLTWKKYRHEVRLQIFLPLGIGAIIVIALAVLTAFGSAAQVSQGADTALIWLIGPLIIVSLLFLVISITIVYGLAKLLQVLPFYTRQVQDYFNLARDYVNTIGDKAVAPILSIRSKKASYQALLNNLRRKQPSASINKQDQ